MDHVKSPLKSKTVWAGLAQMLIAACGFLGIDIAPGEIELALNQAESTFVMMTGLLTLVGRYLAKFKIS